MRSHRWRVILLALVTACAACSDKKGEAESTDTPIEEASLVTASEKTTAVKGEELGALIDLIVAEANELPRVEFDPAARAKQLGKDPQAHFQWVRDHTWWAPYRGLLRGSQGVLLDRVGSNLDRAVLLGDLLRHAGHTVRLAHTQLSEDSARKLLAKVRPIPDERRSRDAMKPMSPDRKRLIEAVIPGYTESEQRRIAAKQRIEDAARSLTRSNEVQLQEAIRDMTFDAVRSDDRATLSALRDYWWVERKDDDTWVAMDVLPFDSKLGDAPAPATAVSEWKAEASAPSIPAADWHVVTIRLVVERYEGGTITESSVLETTLRPATVIDQPIRLRHLPKQWPENLPGPDTDPNALGNAAINVRDWIPFLQIGDELIVQSGFTDGGDTVSDPLGRQRDVAEAGGAGFMSGFGEALGGGEIAASSLTAEWIDYEIRVPGESAQSIRRPVFDLLGPALRSAKVEDFDANTNDLLITRSEALLSETEIFLQPCELTVEYVSHLVSAGIAANQVALKELAMERDPIKSRDMASALFAKIDVWSPLLDLAQWRSALGNHPTSWFVSRPNVLNYRVSPPVVNADRATIREAIDIASNAIGVRESAGRNSFQIRVRQGVTDTVAELVALGGDLRGTENTASIISMALEANAGALVRPRDVAAIRDLDWPADAAARAAATLEAGYAVVALKQPVELDGRARTGWWRIDPATGETIGVMDTGYHQALNERELSDFQLNYMLTYRHLYQPSVQRALLREQARRNFMEFGLPVVALAAVHVVAFVAMSLAG